MLTMPYYAYYDIVLLLTYGAISPLQYIVVVADIDPPVTRQHKMLTCWTIRSLFITVTTLLLDKLDKSAPA